MSDASLHLRPVRSFVIRGGRLTPAQERALTELWPRYGIDYTAPPPDFDAIFGRAAPRMMEIGFGAGESLLEYARAHPEVNCIGVEVHRPGVGRLLLNAHAAQLTNLRIMCHDAVEVLTALAPGCLDTIHIFFPDPWHKKRHHKRRLIQPPFVKLLTLALRIHGSVRLATDWEPYAMQMLEVLNANPLLSNRAAAAGFIERLQERPLTRFEKRGHRLGHAVWDLEFQRVGGQAVTAVIGTTP